MLSSYRVLDLTDDKGFLCGKMLADLGADVIKIEKPGGDPSRNRGPFYKDTPHPERSLFWWSYNQNKKGITLDIETSDGKEIFLRLVEKADFVIESFRVGYMEELGLLYSTLSKINPRIIMASISPFGQTGPYKSFEGPDIVGEAMSGFMYLTGDTDRQPVRISFDQAYLNTCAQAAMGSMAALLHRNSSGKGQYIDVSMQQTMCVNIYRAVADWAIANVQGRRAGQGWKLGPRKFYQTWRCVDGHVTFMLLGGAAWGQKANSELVKWVDSEGLATDFLKSINWAEFDMGTITQETLDAIQEPIANFFSRYTMAELYEGAVARRIILYPSYSIKGLTEDPQLKARGFWSQVEHPELGSNIVYPGTWATETDANKTPKSARRAPLIGEHNLDIYEKEMGMSRETIVNLKQAGVI